MAGGCIVDKFYVKIGKQFCLKKWLCLKMATGDGFKVILMTF